MCGEKKKTRRNNVYCILEKIAKIHDTQKASLPPSPTAVLYIHSYPPTQEDVSGASDIPPPSPTVSSGLQAAQHLDSAHAEPPPIVLEPPLVRRVGLRGQEAGKGEGKREEKRKVGRSVYSV